MKPIIRILFFAAIGLFTLFSYRRQTLLSLIFFACAGSLWLANFLLYARGKPTIDTSARFEPVSFIVGVFFVVMGVWDGIRFLPHVPSVIGAIFIGGIFVVFPIVLGITIMRKQLRHLITQ